MANWHLFRTRWISIQDVRIGSLAASQQFNSPAAANGQLRRFG